MNPTLSKCLAAIALLVVAAPVQAQQQELTAEDVENYVEQIRQDAAQMMEAEDPQQFIAWARSNFAEGATFQVSLTILSGDESKAYSSMTLDSGDIVRLVGLLAGAFGQGAFQDYSLEADVGEVTSHGPAAATARIDWTERFTLHPAGLMGNGGQMPQGEGFSVEVTAACSHLVRRQGDQMQLGLTTCSVEMGL